jgi:hypothetical protein
MPSGVIQSPITLLLQVFNYFLHFRFRKQHNGYPGFRLTLLKGER